MNSNQQSNRLQLNFGGGDRNQYSDGGRAFPTTPSTFPQPIGQQEVWGAQQQQQGNGYGGSGGGYFPSPYQQAQYQGQQGNLQAQHLQQRFDANGLAQQLSSQHLGGNGRSGSPYGRGASPNPQRPRTADNRGYGYGSYGSSQGGPRQPSLYDEEAPKRQPEKYSDNVEKQATMSKSLINTFFKDSVQRARDRNQRYGFSISLARNIADVIAELWS
jgi:protein-serine/threonine kinase